MRAFTCSWPFCIVPGNFIFTHILLTDYDSYYARYPPWVSTLNKVFLKGVRSLLSTLGWYYKLLITRYVI